MKRSRDDDDDVYKSSQLKPKEASQSYGDRDLSVDHPDPELDKGLMRSDKEQRRCSGKEIDSRAEPLHDDGICPISSTCVDETSLKSMHSQAHAFLQKVKEKLRNTEDFQKFLKCLHIYSVEIITRQELQSLVCDLLGKYAGLVDEFNDFLSQCEKTHRRLAESMAKKGSSNLS